MWSGIINVHWEVKMYTIYAREISKIKKKKKANKPTKEVNGIIKVLNPKQGRKEEKVNKEQIGQIENG